MRDFTQELSSVEALYEELESVLRALDRSVEAAASDGNDPLGSLDGIVVRSCALDRSLAELADSWQAERGQLQPDEANSLSARAQQLQGRASHLQRQVRQFERALHRMKEAALASLGEIHNGARFLKSMSSGSPNEPRFLDTRE